MQSLRSAVERAISICGSGILEEKQIFLHIIEDLVPYQESEFRFLKKSYDADLGKMLKDAYNSSGQREQYLIDILNYLSDEVGLSEKKANQFISFFVFLGCAPDVKSNTVQSSQNDSLLKTITDKRTDEKNTIIDLKEEMEIEYEITYGNLTKAIEMFNNSERALMTRKSYSNLCLLIGEALEDDEPQKAIEYLKKSANKGNARAWFLLGYMYENGEGGSVDLNQAASCYRIAADAGYRGAQHNLACFYYFGNGVNKDYKLAFEYFLKAAKQGKADSMKNIGVMYEIGQYVEKDFKKALEWYDKARECGDSEADEYYRILEKKIKKSINKRVLFRVLNKNADKKDMYINVGEEVRGKILSNALTMEPVLKLLINENTKQIGVKNLSKSEWTIIKANKQEVICSPNKVVPLEQGDMIRIINKVVQLNVLSILEG